MHQPHLDLDQVLTDISSLTREQVAKLYLESSTVYDDSQSRAYARIFPKQTPITTIEAAFILDQLIEHYMEIEAWENSEKGDDNEYDLYATLQGKKVATITALEPTQFKPYAQALIDHKAVTPEQLQRMQQKMSLRDTRLVYAGKSITELTLSEAKHSLLVGTYIDDFKLILEFNAYFVVMTDYSLA